MKSSIYVPCLKSFFKCAAINNSPVKKQNRQRSPWPRRESSISDSKGKFYLLASLLLFSVLQRLLQSWCCIIVFLSWPNSALSLPIILARPHSFLPPCAFFLGSSFIAPKTLFALRTLSRRKGTALVKSKAREQSGSLRIPGDCRNKVKHFPYAYRGKVTNPLLRIIWIGIIATGMWPLATRKEAFNMHKSQTIQCNIHRQTSYMWQPLANKAVFDMPKPP